MCTRDSAATIGINDFFLLFKKKWHMPCQCGGEQGCYKIAQLVWKFLKIFPPLITVEFLLLILLFDLKTVSYEFGWATTLLPEQAAACSNDRHSQKSLQAWRSQLIWRPQIRGSWCFAAFGAMLHVSPNAQCCSKSYIHRLLKPVKRKNLNMTITLPTERAK